MSCDLKFMCYTRNSLVKLICYVKIIHVTWHYHDNCFCTALYFFLTNGSAISRGPLLFEGDKMLSFELSTCFFFVIM